MAEWSNAPILKTGAPEEPVGSSRGAKRRDQPVDHAREMATTLSSRLLKNDFGNFRGNHRTADPTEKRNVGHFRASFFSHRAMRRFDFEKQGFFQQPARAFQPIV
jgi:hypothetical protein